MPKEPFAVAASCHGMIMPVMTGDRRGSGTPIQKGFIAIAVVKVEE
jgi:hypothetical protein